MPNRNIILYTSVLIFFFFAIFVYVPILPVYSRSMGIRPLLIGIISGSYGLFQILFRIPAGLLSDRLKKRKIFIIIGVFFGLLSCVSLYFAQGFWGLLGGRLLAGGAMVSWVIMIAHFAAYFPRERAANAMGILMAINFVGQMIGNYTGGLAYERLGLRVPFLLGIGSALIALIFSFFVKELKPAEGSKPVHLMELLAISRNRIVFTSSILGLTLHFLTFATVFSFTPVIMKSEGAGGAQVGLLVFLFSLGSVLGSSLLGIHRFKPDRRVLTALSFLFLGAGCFSTPFISSILMFYIFGFLMGFGRGILTALLSSLVIADIEPRQTATATGFFQTLISIGILSGPMITGVVVEYSSYTPAYLLLGVVALLSVVLTIRNIPPKSFNG